MSYKTAEIATALALLFMTAVCFFAIRNIPADAFMFPGIVLAGLAFGSTILLVRAVTGASQRTIADELVGWRFSIAPTRMLIGFVLFAAYIFLTELLGYFTASALFIITLSYMSNYRSWTKLICVSISFCVMVYLVFVLLFARPLPQEWFMHLLSFNGMN